MSDFISPCCSPLICSPPLVAAVGASFFMCGFPLLNTASNCLSIYISIQTNFQVAPLLHEFSEILDSPKVELKFFPSAKREQEIFYVLYSKSERNNNDNDNDNDNNKIFNRRKPVS